MEHISRIVGNLSRGPVTDTVSGEANIVAMLKRRKDEMEVHKQRVEDVRR